MQIDIMTRKGLVLISGIYLNKAAALEANRNNLVNADLEDVDLSGVDLRGANLEGANMTGVNLEGADLSGANMKSVMLSLSNLNHAILSGATVTYANLSGSTLVGANLSGITLSWTNLSDAYLIRVNLKDANLTGALITGSDLTDVVLCRADISGADLSRSNLNGADLSGADLSGADLSGANVSGIKYDAATMRGKYKGIRIDSSYGDVRFRQDAQDQDLIDTLEANCPSGWKKLWFHFWSMLDYGRSVGRFFFLVFAVVVIFGTIYKLLPELLDNGGHQTTWLTPYLFSFITFVTLGFGAVTAQGIYGELLVILELAFGFATLSFILPLLVNKVVRRS